MENEPVNIILPILNRPEHTEQCLSSLFETTRESLFDLTIVDDGSDNHTKEIINHYFYGHKNVFVITRKEGESKGPGFSRNEGALSVTQSGRRGKYLYHCDNDVFYQRGWLEKLVEIYEIVSPHSVALIGASCHPYLQNYATRNLTPYLLDYKIGIKDAVSGYSQLMSWEIWDRFGEFTTQEGLEKKTGRSDDWEYCQRLIKAGFLVGSVEPELIIPCGKTDTYGDPAVGQETFRNHEGVIIK